MEDVGKLAIDYVKKECEKNNIQANDEAITFMAIILLVSIYEKILKNFKNFKGNS